MQKILIESGFDYSGKDMLTSGITGQSLEAYVFFGPIYYQKLKVRPSFSLPPLVILSDFSRLPSRSTWSWTRCTLDLGSSRDSPLLFVDLACSPSSLLLPTVVLEPFLLVNLRKDEVEMEVFVSERWREIGESSISSSVSLFRETRAYSLFALPPSLVGYGATQLMLERLMISSDAFETDACQECGLMGYNG